MITLEDWNLVSEKMPEKRIRVIGATEDFVVGDVYYGFGSMRFVWDDRKNRHIIMPNWQKETWRYSDTEREIPIHNIPIYWTDLPDSPKKLKEKK